MKNENFAGYKIRLEKLHSEVKIYIPKKLVNGVKVPTLDKPWSWIQGSNATKR